MCFKIRRTTDEINSLFCIKKGLLTLTDWSNKICFASILTSHAAHAVDIDGMGAEALAGIGRLVAVRILDHDRTLVLAAIADVEASVRIWNQNRTTICSVL